VLIMQLDAVVLDVDGTLVDSVYLHVAAWVSAFDDVGVAVPAYSIHRAIGMGGDRLVAEVAGDAVERAVGDDVRARHAHHFEQGFSHVKPLDGAAELMTLLRQRGVSVTVASSGEREQTDRLLDLVEGADAIQERVSGSDADRSKPAPDLIDEALERAQGSRALCVGDAVWDVVSAGKAGVPCVGVLTGGISAGELLEAGALAVVATPRELVERFDEIQEKAFQQLG